MGRISTGHARALITIENGPQQELLLDKIITNEWSVRQVEDAVRNLQVRGPKTKAGTRKQAQDIELLQISNTLRQRLGTHVSIRKKPQGGEIRIQYYSNEDLDRLLGHFDPAS